MDILKCKVCDKLSDVLYGTICGACMELVEELAKEEMCEHSEHEHFVCIDCGEQLEPSDYYDEDYGLER